MKKIYVGQEAYHKHIETLASYDKEKCIYACNLGTAGYWFDSDEEVWVAYDNEQGHAWVEEFETAAAAKAWAEGQPSDKWIKKRLT